MLGSCSDQGLTNTSYFSLCFLFVLAKQHFQKTLEKIALDTEVLCFFCFIILSVCIESALSESP